MKMIQFSSVPHTRLAILFSISLLLMLLLAGVSAAAPAEDDSTKPRLVRLVKDINPGPGGSGPEYFTIRNGALCFQAFDQTNGTEPWCMAGSNADATLAKDILPGSDGSIEGDGSGTPFQGFASFDGALYFSAFEGVNGRELWKTDSTGTMLVKDINAGDQGSSFPAEFAVFDGALYFSASDDANGRELWKTDGTADGTVLVKDIYTGTGITSRPNDGSPAGLTVYDGALYFRANDGVNGRELWKTDGTADGTVLVKDIYPGIGFNFAPNNGSPDELAVFDGALYFAAGDDPNGRELWKTDGTADGTVLVKDIRPGPVGAAPSALTVFDGALYFTADDGVNGQELWKTDGTEAGTVLVKDIYPGADDSDIVRFTLFNGALYFAADDGTHGGEPWRSDGTEAGTMLVKDINPGPDTSLPIAPLGGFTDPFVPLGDLLYFRANDGTSGMELWETDGTDAGTMLVADIKPGAEGSSPDVYAQFGAVDRLIAYNGDLYFSANDGVHGSELWVLETIELYVPIIQRQ